MDYYETMLRVAETEDIKIQVRPEEMRSNPRQTMAIRLVRTDPRTMTIKSTTSAALRRWCWRLGGVVLSAN